MKVSYEKNKKLNVAGWQRNSQGFQISHSIFFGLLLIAIGISSLSYLFQVNQVAVMGTKIMERKNKIKELNKEKEALNITSIKLRSIENLEKNKEELGMVKPNEIGYMEINHTVAMKD